MDGSRTAGTGKAGGAGTHDGQPLITAEAVAEALREARRQGGRFIEVDPVDGTVRTVRPRENMRAA